jgi:hypothetical protein
MTVQIGSLLISLGLESGAFKSGLSDADKELKKATRRMEAVGQSMQNLGQQLSLAVTVPLIAMGTAAVRGFQEQQQAMAQVEAALKSMGGVSGKTAAELEKAADALEMNSLIDADVILKQVTAQLLTFGNIANAEFDRAQQAAIDMATRLGSEPQAAAIQLGKALNDPIKGVSALTKVGIQFTDAQKAQIKAMVEVNNVAGAQGIILGEVERQFKGAAKAAADTSPWRQAKVAIGQAGDEVGKALNPYVEMAAKKIAELARAFNELPQGTKNLVMGAAAVGAALGPVISILGTVVSATAPFTAAIGMIGSSGGVMAAASAAISGLGAALGPVLVPLGLVAAAGAVIYANWDKIGPVLEELWTTAQKVLGPPLQELVTSISGTLQELWKGPLGEGIRMVVSALGDLLTVQLKVFGPVVIGVLKVLVSYLSNTFKAIGDGARAISALFKGDFSTAAAAIDSAMNRVFFGLPHKVRDSVKKLVEAVREWMVDKLDAVWEWVRGKIKVVGDAFYKLYDAVVGHSYIPDMVDGIAAQMARLDAVMVDPAKSATEQARQAFEELGRDVQQIMSRLFPEARAIADLRGELGSLDRGIAAGGAGGYSPDQLRAARQRLLQNADPATRAGVALPLSDYVNLYGGSLGPDMQQIQAELDNIGKAANDNAAGIEVANVRIVNSFKDMVEQTMSAIGKLGDAIKGGDFFDILDGLVGLGIQLGSIGLFGKGAQNAINAPKAFALGTNYAPGGLALVGERGPELVNLPRGSTVTPNHRLGAGGVTNNYFSGNLMTPEFWARIHAGDAQAAQAGVQGGLQQLRYMNSRRWAG